MPMNSVQFKPGVNTQKTLALNETGISQSQLIRYKDGLVQSYGGWDNYVSFTMGSTIRDLHAWQDAAGNQYLSAAGHMTVTVITAGSAGDITPQTRTSDFAPNFSISSGNAVVTIVDVNSGLSVFDTVYFNTPISIGNLLLNGAYDVTAVLSTGSFTITSSVAASTTINSSGILPVFQSTANSPTVTVTIPNNGFLSVPGLFYNFIAPTSVGGLTIQGKYEVSSIINSTVFTITANSQSSATATSTMNGGLAELEYFITIGPQPLGSGFGAGGFGSGGFGTGTATTGTVGTAITADDWSQDNWGQVLLACPTDGPIYSWAPNSGFQNMQVLSEGPFFNGGIFISMPQQILVAWRSCQSTGAQDQLTVRWSDSDNYFQWAVNNQTSAGSFRIPTGSFIVGGIQCPNYGLISTDVDVWVMNYIGGDETFNFTRVGSGCGWVGQHAAGTLSGVTYWCGTLNFFMLQGSGGVQPMPCDVWDAIFQNMNQTYKNRVVCAVNTSFNEITWFYPSINSTGENDSYVKVHIEGQEYEWDYGVLARTAWVDASILGGPIGADPSGALLQHETGNSITGVSLPSFRSGWWAISNGTDLSYVDMIMPDFQWGVRSGAQDAIIALTFYSVDYPGDTPKVYGPYTVTQATEYLRVGIRGRLMSVMVQLQNAEFFRLGNIRYRWAPAGRR